MESNRRALQDNFMLGALGGDTSFASAIMDAAEKDPIKSPKGGIRDFDYVNTKYAMSDPNSDQVSRRNINTNYGENVKPSEQQMGPPIELMGKETNTEAAPNKPDFRDLMQQHLMDSWNNQGKQAEQDKWMSLLSAGLGMMGGTSPYAAANIGQGAQQGIAAHLAARKAQQAQQNSLLSGYGILSKDRYYDAIADKSGTAAKLAELTGEKNDRTAAQQSFNAVSANIRAIEARKAKLAKDDPLYSSALYGIAALKNKKDLTKDDLNKLNKYKQTISEAEGDMNQELAGYKQQQAYLSNLLGIPSMSGGNEGGGRNVINLDKVQAQ